MPPVLTMAMGTPPSGLSTICPTCGRSVWAIVPQGSELVEEEEHADGKVWTNCHECGKRFLVYYRTRE